MASLPAIAQPRVVAQPAPPITIGTTDFPLSLDPATAIDQPSWEILNHLYTGLTEQVSGTLDYDLALASQYEISSDGLQHTFTLRPSIAFDDGTPITAYTFVDSVNRVSALGRAGAEFVNRYVAAVEAPDPSTVRFTLNHPLPDFEALVGLPPFFPQHPDSYPPNDILDPQLRDPALITNGPYRLQEYIPGVRITLSPNPDYTGEPTPQESIVIQQYSLPVDLAEALQAHEVDIAWRALVQTDLETIRQNPALITLEQPGLQMFYLLLNHNTITLNNQNSFDDPALRQAISRLVDREATAELGWDGFVDPAYTLLPSQFASSVRFPAYDYANADELLQEAGYRERRRTASTTLLISTDTYGDLLASAAAELRRGIEQSKIFSIAGIQDSQTPTFINAVNRGEYLSAIIGWTPHFASPAAYLFALVHSSSPLPVNAAYTSAELDRLLEQAGAERDQAIRQALYATVEQSLLDNLDIIPLWQGKHSVTYWDDIEGVVIEANGWLRYERLTR
ncbi:MAG: ABC transporter substrate-binding protein [Anaerolineae bacterium]